MILNPKKLPTVGEYTYDSIKKMIVTGELIPESRIHLDKLAESLGVSRVPVRGALDRLVSENLVEDIPRRGMLVKSLSINHLKSIYTMRVSLESLAIVSVIDHASDLELASIKQLLDEQKFDLNNIGQIMVNNYDFHYNLFILSKDDTLCKVLENIWMQCDRYRYIFYKQYSYNNKRIISEHRQLFELVKNRDKQGSLDLLAKHTWHSYETLSIILGAKPDPLSIRQIAN